MTILAPHLSAVVSLKSAPPRHEGAEGYEAAGASRLKAEGQLLVSANFTRPSPHRSYTSHLTVPSVNSSMVVPPFGFGVGDFLAVAKLTGKVVSELKDVRH